MQITEFQKKNFKKTARRYSCDFLVLFGSQTHEKTHGTSDVDIAFSSQKKFNYKEEYQLNRELAKILRRDDIDLVNLKNASPLLHYYAAFQSQPLSIENQKTFDEFQIYSFKRYVEEAKPLLLLKEEYLKHHIP